MPRQTERQALTNNLLELFLIQMLSEGQAELLKLLDDDSDASESEDEELCVPLLSGVFLTLLAELHATHYLQDRVHIPKNGGQLWLTLACYKTNHPSLFRSLLRVSPRTFNALLSKVQGHPVFQNNSENEQISVDSQVAIVLYRLGHFGNAASMEKVGLWAGYGYRTVDKGTWCVMTAVCDEGFRRVVMRWPNERQKEEVSDWVESHLCVAWRGGWLMVDGTLGNSWYDHKSNYSLNMQLILTPDLCIIDYGLGLPGSQHDATAWKATWVPWEHNTLLGPDEWVWADTAYPLQTWCQAPYKRHRGTNRPNKDIPENGRYNYYVSRVRVRSEHCVGFLKGQWSSLRGLQLHIDNPTHIQFTVIWVTTCIVLHNSALLHEAKESAGVDVELNEFFREGLELLEDEQRDREARDGMVDEEEATVVQLIQGRLRHENLKQQLFDHLDGSNH
ncbi:hypothetical protein K439DRAFT_1649956 [Ramaria rubella]|nr:hypothetical protein K439DRAFT_1649956 [Ramaria rubella]